MPFCWMDEGAANSGEESGQTRAESTAVEIKDRAQLMRRLGYAKSAALHRCLGNVAWAYSVSGTPALSPAKIRKIVGEAYAGAA
jgi:hypothetical protein